MTQIPAGWYPDPALTPGNSSGRLRYWDGTGWTEHVHDQQPQYQQPQYQQPQYQQPAYPGYPEAGSAPHEQPAAQQWPPQYPAAGQATHPQSSQPPPYAAPARTPVKTTPDGQPLSGWWRRVAAQVLDALIMIPLYLVAAVVAFAPHWDEIQAWFEDTVDASDNGASTPPLPDVFEPWSSAYLTFTLVLLVLTAAYTLGFWAWKQATPGKLIVGTRIRRRDERGPLPWSTMLARFGFVQLLSIGTNMPALGFLFLIGALLDYLWPLWDGKNQALHDKVAGTNVVLAEPAGTVLSDHNAMPPAAADDSGLPRAW